MARCEGAGASARIAFSGGLPRRDHKRQVEGASRLVNQLVARGLGWLVVVHKLVRVADHVT